MDFPGFGEKPTPPGGSIDSHRPPYNVYTYAHGYQGGYFTRLYTETGWVSKNLYSKTPHVLYGSAPFTPTPRIMTITDPKSGEVIMKVPYDQLNSGTHYIHREIKDGTTTYTLVPVQDNMLFQQ